MSLFLGNNSPAALDALLFPAIGESFGVTVQPAQNCSGSVALVPADELWI